MSPCARVSDYSVKNSVCFHSYSEFVMPYYRKNKCDREVLSAVESAVGGIGTHTHTYCILEFGRLLLTLSACAKKIGGIEFKCKISLRARPHFNLCIKTKRNKNPLQTDIYPHTLMVLFFHLVVTGGTTTTGSTDQTVLSMLF